jgi:hypothetical protein
MCTQVVNTRDRESKHKHQTNAPRREQWHTLLYEVDVEMGVTEESGRVEDQLAE